MSGIVPPNDLTNIDFKKGTRTPRPLPPPGHAYDGQASEDLSALYPAEVQETTITLGGTTVVGDVTTLTIEPTLTASGSAWADDLVPLVFTFTTAANPDDTLAKVAEGIAANAVAQQTVVDLEDFSNFNRVKDFIEVTSDGVDIIVATRDSGASFTYLLEVTPAGITETSVTTGGTSDPLRVGLIGMQTAVNVKGERQIGVTGSTVLGLIMYSGKVRPRNIGDQWDAYERGPHVVYRHWGTGTAYAEKGVAVDGLVYRRTTAVSPQTLGAVTDTPTTVQQITVGVPTVVNDTLYRLQLTVTDLFTGAVKASGVVSYTSDASATAAEIVDNTIVNLGTQAAAVDALLAAANVADELELTANSGCVVSVLDLEGNFPFGADAPAASSEHALVVGSKFLQTTPAAGTAPIFLPHP